MRRTLLSRQLFLDFSLFEYILSPTVSFKELSANLRTALAAFSGSGTTSDLSLGESVDSFGDIEVIGTKKERPIMC